MLTQEAVKDALSTHCQGRENARKAGDLVALCTGRRGNRNDARVVRQLVQKLRSEGVPICSHSTAGYWWPATAAELDRSMAFLRVRAIESLRLIRAMRRYRAVLVGQLAFDPAQAEPETHP
ncbi:MAG: hypothetical protein ACFB0C_19700 [Leptolyngbyaceae cyanobacterium]